MADQITGSTELDNQKNELISGIVQDALRQESVVASTLTDVSQFAVKGMKSIAFPYANPFTVQKRVSGQKGSAQAFTMLNDTLALNENAYISWIIENFDQLQSAADISAEAVKEAAVAHSIGFDDDCIAALVAGGHADNAVTFSAAITKENILSMRRKLRDQKVKPRLGDWTLLVKPAQEEEMLSISGFVEADKYGNNRAVTMGEIGALYGVIVKVTESDELPDDSSLMYHRRAAVYGFQSGAKYGSESALDYGVGTLKEAIDQLYGVKVMQSGKMISKLA